MEGMMQADGLLPPGVRLRGGAPNGRTGRPIRDNNMAAANGILGVIVAAGYGLVHPKKKVQMVNGQRLPWSTTAMLVSPVAMTPNFEPNITLYLADAFVQSDVQNVSWKR